MLLEIDYPKALRWQKADDIGPVASHLLDLIERLDRECPDVMTRYIYDVKMQYVNAKARSEVARRAETGRRNWIKEMTEEI